MRFILAGLTACVLSLPLVAARASGYCEGLTTHYQLIGVADAKRLLAYEVKKEFCDESAVMNPQPFEQPERKLTAILVTDLDNRTKSWFFTPANALERQNAPEGRRQAMSAWPEYEQAQGFVPPLEVALPAAPAPGKCSTELLAILPRGKSVPFAEAEASHNFVQRTLALRIRTPDRELPLVNLGEHALSKGLPQVYAAPLVSLGRLRIFFVTAKCVGGPPPGAFGADDGGVCYAEWSRRYTDIAIQKFPAIAPCLPSAQTPASAPKPTPANPAPSRSLKTP